MVCHHPRPWRLPWLLAYSVRPPRKSSAPPALWRLPCHPLPPRTDPGSGWTIGCPASLIPRLSSPGSERWRLPHSHLPQSVLASRCCHPLSHHLQSVLVPRCSPAPSVYLSSTARCEPCWGLQLGGLWRRAQPLVFALQCARVDPRVGGHQQRLSLRAFATRTQKVQDPAAARVIGAGSPCPHSHPGGLRLVPVQKHSSSSPHAPPLGFRSELV